VGKFHVGDRWADQWGREWFVYLVAEDGLTHAIKDGETRVFHEQELDPNYATLTRLISSERWIPFAEMMPDEPANGDSKRLVICSESHQMLLLKGLHGKWTHSESGIPAELSQALIRWSWRYLQPPEASC
jgi:hypothetical protein